MHPNFDQLVKAMTAGGPTGNFGGQGL